MSLPEPIIALLASFQPVFTCGGYMGYPPSKLIVSLFCYLGFDDGMHIESSLGERPCPPRQKLTDHKAHIYLFYFLHQC